MLMGSIDPELQILKGQSNGLEHPANAAVSLIADIAEVSPTVSKDAVRKVRVQLHFRMCRPTSTSFIAQE